MVMVNSEYAGIWGRYSSLPSLPHTTGSQLQARRSCNNQLTKQSDLVPSFEPVQPRMATEKMPMTAKAIMMAAKTRQVDRSQPLFIELVVPSTTVADSRLTWA